MSCDDEMNSSILVPVARRTWVPATASCHARH
jgi:hypothetical protein